MIMSNQNFQISIMSREDLDKVVNWAAEEGWNPGLYDADAFYAADPTGFLIGKIDDIPVAAISAVKYEDTFGFVGFYIVKPAYRGQSYGLQIWNRAIESLSGRNIGLDGVVDQQANYRKSGFNLAHRNMRFEGKGTGKPQQHPAIVDLKSLAFSRIEAYDQQFFPTRRSSFLEQWLRQPESYSFAYIEKNRLKGYGVMRKCRQGYKIGPLFADHPDIAEALFLAFRSNVRAGQPFYLDIPQVNSSAKNLVETYDMQLVFETARMYTGNFPALPLNRIFGITTFELG